MELSAVVQGVDLETARRTLLKTPPELGRRHLKLKEGGHLEIISLHFDPETEASLEAQARLRFKQRRASLRQLEQKAREKMQAAATRERRALEEAEAAWDARVAQLQREVQDQIETLQVEAESYALQMEAEGEARALLLRAEGLRAETLAQAEEEALKIEALSLPGGSLLNALEAVEVLKLGSIHLDSGDPDFLFRFGSPAAWRRFLLSPTLEEPPLTPEF